MTVTYEDGVLKVVLLKADEAKPQSNRSFRLGVRGEGAVTGRIKNINQQQVPGNSFVMLCRAFSMISGGFLFGSGVSHNSPWGSILGTAVGVAVFAFNEATVRRVEQ